MKIVLLGSTGQLAYDLKRAFSHEQLSLLGHHDVEITDHAKVREVLSEIAPHVVINTTAYHRVDEMESNVEKAFAVNAAAPLAVARICKGLDSVFVHISTNYVFDGRSARPYVEEDLPLPINVYGNSKLAGEHFVRSIWAKHIVIRTSGLYGVAGSSGKGGNFVEMVLKKAAAGEPLRIVADQILTPTFTQDLSRQIKALVDAEARGLFHVTNGGECSWHEFANAIVEAAGIKAQIDSTDSASYPTAAVRPLYAVLANRGTSLAGIPAMRSWREALQSYLEIRLQSRD